MIVGEPFSPYKLFTGIFIPDALLDYGGINSAEKICLGRLYRYCGKENFCFPSQEQLASDLGVDVRTVHTYLTHLRDDGFISIKQRGLQQSNKYEILGHPVFGADRRDSSGQAAYLTGVTLPVGPEDLFRPDRRNSSGPSIELKRVTLRESVEENTRDDFSFPSEERLTSDVDAVHYSDTEEVELPDDARKSKPQMSTSEVRSFWNQWSRVTMSTPDARAKQRHKYWLSKLRHSDAVTAVNAYRNLATQYDFEDFKKRYSESLRAGISQERATSDPFVKTSPTAGRTSPAAPATPNAQQVAMPGTSDRKSVV